ncbi:MAG: hypothetical protein K1V74_08320 [Muribaculaceae bacterium]
MKKVFFYLLALLPMAACHQAEMDGEILMPPTQEVAEFLSAADAVQIANDIAAKTTHDYIRVRYAGIK